jgi:hypothetical protein
MSFCTRQFKSSATDNVFSEGQEISCTQPLTELQPLDKKRCVLRCIYYRTFNFEDVLTQSKWCGNPGSLARQHQVESGLNPKKNSLWLDSGRLWKSPAVCG